MRARTAVLLALAATSGPASAEPHVVKRKFSIEPPAGWVWNDPAFVHQLGKEAAKQLHLQAAFKGKPPLAVFMSRAATGGFTNNLNVREVDKVMPTDESAVEDFRKTLGRGFGMIKPTIDKAEITYAAGRKVLRAEWRYRLINMPMRVIQIGYPGRGSTFISTYTVHESTHAAEMPGIEASIESFKSIEPWYAWFAGRPIITFGIVGGVVGAIVALLLRRRASA